VLTKYSFVWSLPGVPGLVALGAAGRLLYVSMPFCLLIYGLSERPDPFFGSALSAAFAIGAAVGVPITSGWAAHGRSMLMMTGCGLIATAGLIAVTVLPASAAVAVAVAVGLCFPPFGPLARTIWPSVLPEGPLRQRAQAFEASLTELVSVIGPVLVAAVAAVTAPRHAVLMFAAGTLLASVAFGRRHAGRQLAARDAELEAARRPAGKSDGIRPSRSLVMLCTGVFIASAAYGVLQVCLSVSLESGGHAASSAGFYLGLLAVGSVVGGIAYGVGNWTATGFVRYGRVLGVLSLGLLGIALTLDQPLLPVMMLLAGVPFAAVATEEFGMVESLTSRHSLARATGLLLSVYSLGDAAGLLVGGLALPGLAESHLLLLAAVAVAAMALLLPRLRPAIPAGDPAGGDR
jgi:hypothetical protein